MKELNQIVDFVFDMKEDRPLRLLDVVDIQLVDGHQCRYEGRLPKICDIVAHVSRLDAQAFKYVRQAVEAFNPDMITLSGDNVYGEFDDKGTLLPEMIRRFDGYKIPWFGVFGNHDNETMMGVDWTVEQYENAKYGMFKWHPELEGNSNYSIAITCNGKLKNVFFAMDTNGCFEGDFRDPKAITKAGIYPKQMQWFKDTVEALKELNGGEYVPALLFTHIAFRPIHDALNERYGLPYNSWGWYGDSGKPFERTYIPENNPYGDFGAILGEGEPAIDNPEFMQMVKESGVVGLFYGHKHSVCASLMIDGIRHTYGLKTGNFVCGTKELRGTTLITIDGKDLDVKHRYHDFSLDYENESEELVKE